MRRILTIMLTFLVLIGSCGGPLVPSQMTSEVLLGDYTNYQPRYIADCVLWLDGNDPLAVGAQPADGSALGVWKDKSGFGNDVMQSVPANQPLYRRSSQNARGAVHFVSLASMAGSNTPAGFTFGTDKPKSVYIVTEFGTAIPANNVVPYIIGPYSGGDNGNNAAFGFFPAASGYFSIDSGGTGGVVAVSSPTIVPGTGYLLSFRNQKSDILLSKTSLNNNPTPPINFGYNSAIATLAPGTIKLYVSAPADQGLLLEIIVYDRELSDAEDARVRAYLSQKWGL